MMKKVILFALAAVMTLALGCAMADGGIEFTTTGTGVVRVQPDIVTISANAQAVCGSVGEAQSEISRIVDAATKKLIELGVAEDDIVTNYYNYYPAYDYTREPAVITGYNAYHSLTIVCRDVEMLDAAIGALTDSGFTSLDSIEFGIADDSEAYRQALTLAIDDAKAKAETMAQTLGAKDIRAEEVVEGGSSYAAYGRADKEMATAATGDMEAVGIRHGGVSVSASVTMRFEAK